MRLLDHFEAATAILRRIAVRIDRLADEGPIGLSVARADLGHGDDFIDDARQFITGFGTFNLGKEYSAIEVVEFFVEDSDEPDVFVPGVLQVGDAALCWRNSFNRHYKFNFLCAFFRMC